MRRETSEAGAGVGDGGAETILPQAITRCGVGDCELRGLSAASVACGESTNHGMYECWQRFGQPGDFAKQVASEMIIGSAETVQQAVQSGAEIAARMTEYSAANVNAIVKSNVELVELTRTISRNWMCFAQEGIERGFGWFRSPLQCRAVNILPIRKRKPCALILMPFSDTRDATSPCVWPTR
jgi:hypothetical protein